MYFGELTEWEALHNLRDERQFIGRLVRNLTGLRLAHTRWAVDGIQLRLTPDVDALVCELDWSLLAR